MSWSYSGDPSTNEKDEVRFVIGDTETEMQLVTDEEIAYLLDEYGSVTSASIEAVKRIIAKLSKKVSKELRSVIRIEYSHMVKNYRELLKDLEQSNATASDTGMLSSCTHSAIFDVGMMDDPSNSASLDNDEDDC